MSTQHIVQSRRCATGSEERFVNVKEMSRPDGLSTSFRIRVYYTRGLEDGDGKKARGRGREDGFRDRR